MVDHRAKTRHQPSDRIPHYPQTRYTYPQPSDSAQQNINLMRLSRHILALFAIFTLITALSLAIQRLRHPTVTWIAFTRAEDTYTTANNGPARLFRMTPDGEHLQPLTTTSIYGNSPLAWSPDGTRIAYTADICQNSCYTPYTHTRLLYILADTPAVVSSAALYPTWSSDGEWLYYWSADAYARRFYKMRPDGAQKTILATGISFAAASPDDSMFAFISAATSSTEGLYLVFDDGRQVTPLTTGVPFFSDLSWSPNGHYMAFVNETESASFIVLVSLITGESRVLTNEYVHINPSPAWSPNSQSIIFSATHDPNRANSELYRAFIDGHHDQQLTDTPTREYSARWSPDGQWISFIADTKGFSTEATVNSDLVLMRPDGSERHILPNTHGVVNLPTWSPLIDLPFHPLHILIPTAILVAIFTLLPNRIRPA